MRALALSALAATLMAGGPVAPKRPNVLLVFPDQMRGSAMGFLGEEPVKTPRLDQFARQSVVFSSAVANYPVSSPTRASLLTGQHGFKNGVRGNCNSKTAPFAVELRQDALCWSDILAREGYALGYIGKWHLDAPQEPFVDCSNNKGPVAWNEWCPPERRHGFQHWYAYGTFDEHNRPMYWTADAKRDGFYYVNQWGPEHEADQALRYIRNEGGKLRDASKPFALVVSMNPPHSPYNQVPASYVEQYKDLDVEKEATRRPQVPPADTEMGANFRKHLRNQYGMITGVDAQFGRILDGLKEAGVEDDTIVFFFSDHGDCLGAHGEVTKNNPHEESMRIPFLVRWPGKLKPRQDDLLASVVDIYPTLLDLVGLKGRIPANLDAINLAPALRGEKGATRPDGQLYLFLSEKDKPADRAKGRRGLRTADYKLWIDRTGNKPEKVVLIDRKKDPQELKNIAAERPEIVKAMRKDLLKRLRAAGDQWWAE